VKVALLYAAALVLAIVYVLSWRRNVDVDRPPFALGREGAPRALVVWHPGATRFPAEIVRSFAEGLAHSGWNVEVYAANRNAPMDLSRYQLLVLSVPVYWWSPAKPMRRYLARAKDLGGIETIVLLTSSARSERALAESEDLVRRANGRLRFVRTYGLLRPADRVAPQHGLRANRRLARDLAFQAGAAVAPRRTGAA
jgi:hypothetical protein